MARPARLTEELISDYLRRGVWQPFTLSDHWERNANLNPEGVAVSDGARALSWQEAKLWTDRLALAFIQLGLKPDDLLAIQLPNSVELPLIRVACEKAGILSLPLPRTLRQAEMGQCLSFTEAAAIVLPWVYRDFDYFEMIRGLRQRLPRLRHVLIAGDKVPAALWSPTGKPVGRNPEQESPAKAGARVEGSLEEIVHRPWEKEIDPSVLEPRRYKAVEVSLINSTTGSTGPPKFAEYTAAARLLYGRSYVDVLALTAHDVLAALSPAAGGPNIPVYFAAPQVGAKVVLLSHFEPEAAFDLIQRERVTVACVVPALLAMMVRCKRYDRYDLSSIRYWLSVSAPLSSNLARETEEKLGGFMLNTYGAVDWGGVVFTAPEDPPEVRYFTVGRPWVGTEVRLVDTEGRMVAPGETGELQGRGPSCSSGYYGSPDACVNAWTPDGWFPLGDMGRWDEKGNLIIVGRKDELIIRGGQNIQPAEIEDHLVAHPKVKQAAIVGMPDPIMGQKVCAYIVPETADGLTLEEIVSFLRTRQLAPYKLPERLELVDKFPMVSDTKINKRILASEIAEKLERGI